MHPSFDRIAEESLTGVQLRGIDPEAGLDGLFLADLATAGPPTDESSTGPLVAPVRSGDNEPVVPVSRALKPYRHIIRPRTAQA